MVLGCPPVRPGSLAFNITWTPPKLTRCYSPRLCTGQMSQGQVLRLVSLIYFSRSQASKCKKDLARNITWITDLYQRLSWLCTWWLSLGNVLRWVTLAYFSRSHASEFRKPGPQDNLKTVKASLMIFTMSVICQMSLSIKISQSHPSKNMTYIGHVLRRVTLAYFSRSHFTSQSMIFSEAEACIHCTSVDKL